jgi:hypothetical protein
METETVPGTTGNQCRRSTTPMTSVRSAQQQQRGLHLAPCERREELHATTDGEHNARETGQNNHERKRAPSTRQ